MQFFCIRCIYIVRTCIFDLSLSLPPSLSLPHSPSLPLSLYLPSPELTKPAATLYLHNLTGTLESAIRATNTQFEDPDILKRLDVRLLEQSPGDYGWDVFSLHYHVDGPISTVC